MALSVISPFQILMRSSLFTVSSCSEGSPGHFFQVETKEDGFLEVFKWRIGHKMGAFNMLLTTDRGEISPQLYTHFGQAIYRSYILKLHLQRSARGPSCREVMDITKLPVLRLGPKHNGNLRTCRHLQLTKTTTYKYLLLMEEISNNQLGCTKPCKSANNWRTDMIN